MLYAAELYLLAPCGDPLDFHPLRTVREADSTDEAIDDLVSGYAIPPGGSVHLTDYAGRQTRYTVPWDYESPPARKPKGNI